MFDPRAIEEFKSHAIHEYPKEACGLIIPTGYVPCLNTSANPEKEWRIDPCVVASYRNVLAIVHSHPDGPDHPSSADMRQQLATGIPFGIVACNGEASLEPFFWGPGVVVPEYLGRPFRHGPTGSDGRGDCYALVRDWYLHEMQIRLPEVPRDDRWWENGADLYSAFRDHGFRKISIEEIQYGDGILAQIRSPVPNHAGIYLGNGLILHHLAERLSRREPVHGWQKHIIHVVRHESRVP